MTDCHPVNHVGITVSDIEKGIEFYTMTFGLVLIMGPFVMETSEGLLGEICSDLFDENFKKGRIAHLASANGTGIELFDFQDPAVERRDNNFEYWKTGSGIFHICMTAPDIEAMAERIVKNGGRHRSKVWQVFGESEPYKLTYCEDPDGNIIELYSHSYEQMLARRASY